MRAKFVRVKVTEEHLQITENFPKKRRIERELELGINERKRESLLVNFRLCTHRCIDSLSYSHSTDISAVWNMPDDF